jgi:hypothetical protein
VDRADVLPSQSLSVVQCVLLVFTHLYVWQSVLLMLISLTDSTPALTCVSVQAFVTAIKHNFARKHKISIDHLEFTFHVTTPGEEKLQATPEEGAVVKELFLEAACLHSSPTSILKSLN